MPTTKNKSRLTKCDRHLSPADDTAHQQIIKGMVADGLLRYVQTKDGRWTVVATEKGQELAARIELGRRVAKKAGKLLGRMERRLYERSTV
jgi:hypothetical protein